MEPLVFDSEDVGLVEATVSKLYSKMRIGAVGACTRARIMRRVVAPGLGFDDLDYSFDIGYSAEAQGRLIICDVVSSTIRRVGEGYDETFGPGDLFVISRPDLPYGGLAHAPRLRFTVLDPAIFDRVAATMDADPGGPVRLLDHRPVSRPAARHLQRAIAYVRDSVMAVPEAARAPLVVSTASQYLAASILHAFPNSAVTNLAVDNQRDANRGTLRRAVAFIEANPDIDIGVSDIARAACVTPRTVQLAFRRHLGTTPTAYLRQVRLAHAHDDLAQANPGDGTTVTTVAYRWGFSSPSRLAQQYRAAYGSTPSDTLRN
ncbi:MAG: helix-turn-helix transcriptional regulator [Solirubrobacteraceae bacterium]